MVNCVVPVSADNPPAYNLVLVSLHYKEEGSEESQTLRLRDSYCMEKHF